MFNIKAGLNSKSRSRIALLVVALFAVTAGCMGATGGQEAIDYVPGDADGIVHVDAEITTDEDIQTLTDTLATSDPAVEDTDSMLSQFEDQTGLSPDAASEFLYFMQPSDGEGVGSTADQAVIVNAEWSEDEVVESLEGAEETTYEQVDDAPGAVYEPADDQQFSQTSWIGVLGDNMYVIGDEAAVRSSAGVAHDDAPAAEGAIRSGYDKDGLVTFAFVSVSDDIPTDQSVGGGQVDVSALEGLNTVSGSIDTSSGTLELTTDLEANSESDATDIADVVDGGLALVRSSYVQDEATADELREIDVSADGSTVTVNYSGDVEQIGSIIQNYQ